jgi:hypothetical protein
VKTPVKSTTHPLRRVLLWLIIGLAFALWMPFIIVTKSGIHWLNYVIYWGAAWAWIIPFARWMKQNQRRHILYRMNIFAGLFVLWAALGLSHVYIGGHWLLPPDPNHHQACETYIHGRYICYIPPVELPQTKLWELDVAKMPPAIFATRIMAQQINQLPVALVFGYETRIFTPRDIQGWYQAKPPAGLQR